MAEAMHHSSVDSAPDFLALIATLRQAGAGQFDAVRLHYLEVLAQRALAHRGGIRHLLDLRLAAALARFQERLESAQADADATIALLPGAEDKATLAALVRELQQHAADTGHARADDNVGAPVELKTLRQFRTTWSRLSSDKLFVQALEAAPTNAGPINSHMLVLRSLELMRAISPDYLNRFISYADTLLCLDECDKKKTPPAKKPPASKARKKL
jgi:hypothetical protein